MADFAKTTSYLLTPKEYEHVIGLIKKEGEKLKSLIPLEKEFEILKLEIEKSIAYNYTSTLTKGQFSIMVLRSTNNLLFALTYYQLLLNLMKDEDFVVQQQSH